MAAQPVLSLKTPSQLLRLCQSAGPNAKDAQDQVVDVFGDTLKEVTARTCRRYYLPPQERQDVLAETFQQLLNPKIARYSARRGKPGSYLKGLVQNAARKIMAQLGARRRTGDSNCTTATGHDHGGSRVNGYRTLPSPRSPFEDAELHDTVKFVLAQATPRIRRALELCYWDEWTLHSIAKYLGVSRFALRREIDAFIEAMRTRLGST